MYFASVMVEEKPDPPPKPVFKGTISFNSLKVDIALMHLLRVVFPI